MSQFSVKLYNSEYKELWDNFVAVSDIDSFLFHRNFLEYHQDRFEDFSILIFLNDTLVAIIPANRFDATIYSHQGLTFGGLITCVTSEHKLQELFEALKKFLKLKGVREFVIKEVPEIYKKNNNSNLGDLIKHNFISYHQNEILAINFSKTLSIHKTKLKHYRKSDQFNFEIRETFDFEPFWKQILEPRLSEKFNSKPVHNLEEITLLNKRFPNNIKQFDVYINNEILAGVTIFESDTVVKSQYGAVNKEGEKVRALDFLFLQLIENYKKAGKQFFSMGTVTNKKLPGGYNKGLKKQKQEFGCDVFVQDYFKLKF